MIPDSLPRIMVAPNGARRNASDHPNIPLSNDSIIQTVQACGLAGADGAHLHIRDDNGLHTIDAGQYSALLNDLQPLVPDMYLQVTSESAGRYDALQQQHMMRELKPRYVSIALREMVREPDNWQNATAFYTWAIGKKIQIQHIVYSPAELQGFLEALQNSSVPGKHHLLLFVLGSYDGTQRSDPEQVDGFTKLLQTAPAGHSFDWMLCAFGKEETACLVHALEVGGKARIGFENSLYHNDGSLADSNAARVQELVSRL